MAAKRHLPQELVIESRKWTSTDEIDRAITKLKRRVNEIESIDIQASFHDSSIEDVPISNVHETMREVFGPNSPEFKEYEYIELWDGGVWVGMSDQEMFSAKERGKKKVIGILNGLINRIAEKREELEDDKIPTSKAFLDCLNLHPRISDVVTDLFKDGYPWEAVFAASKALVNYVKEKSGKHDLDGAQLMRTVFSKANPVLAFNDLGNQTETDEQEGMMHLFEGVVLGIRNPGGHSFPEGPRQRAVEYLSLISLLAYRVQEAKLSR
jgi:uncharacterized protein (TIGR02391 family)